MSCLWVLMVVGVVEGVGVFGVVLDEPLLEGVDFLPESAFRGAPSSSDTGWSFALVGWSLLPSSSVSDPSLSSTCF